MKTGKEIGYDAPNLGQYNRLIDHLKQNGVGFREMSDTNGSVKMSIISIYDRNYDGQLQQLDEQTSGIEPIGIIRITPSALYAQVSNFDIACIVDDYLDRVLEKKNQF